MKRRCLCITLLLYLGWQPFVAAQGPDCPEALVICTSGAQSFTPQGPGFDDFTGANDEGCLEVGENQTAWYVFGFRDDMPPGSIIEFVLTPSGGFGEDYDFAIYGPDVTCTTLGSPIRCSYASSVCAFCPTTGLGNGETDFSEPASGNGFVAPMAVNPGEVYIIVIDNWLGSSQGFTLNWGGSAAPYLDCTIDPSCELEVAVIPDEVSVCAGGESVELEAVLSGDLGAASVLWNAQPAVGLAFLSNPFSLNPTLDIPATYSGPSVITYTVMAVEDNCDASAQVTVTVNRPPVVSISGPAGICPDVGGQLIATPGFDQYNWSTGDAGPVTPVFFSGVYDVTVTDENGCVGEASFTVEEYPLPEPEIVGPSDVCPGVPALLSLSESYLAYQWSTNQSTPTISVASPGSYAVTVINSFGCEASDATFILPANAPQPDITGALTFCEGASTTLTATPSGLAAYRWSTGAQTASLSATAPGTYRLTVTDVRGCQGTDEVTITENPAPAVAISGDLAICPGENTTLQAQPTGYPAYLWSTASMQTAINADTAGVYAVTVTDALGCQNTASVAVSLFALPVPAIQGPDTVCADVTALLQSLSSWPTYRWSTGDTTQQINALAAGAYGLTVTDGNGCQGETAYQLAHWPLPTPDIAGPTSTCAGAGALLDAGAGYAFYIWSSGDTTQTVFAANTGQYHVAVTSAQGCTGRDTTALTETPLPIASISGPAAVCPGGSVSLAATSGYAGYRWSNGDSTAVATALSPGQYVVTVTDAFGCQNTAEYTLGLHSVTAPTISGETAFCPGLSTLLSASTGFVSYNWSNGLSGSAVTIDQPGDYELIATDANGCETAASVAVSVWPVTIPDIVGPALICPADSVVWAATPGFEVYLWSTGSDVSTAKVQAPGDYSLTVTDAHGCRTETSASLGFYTVAPPAIGAPAGICENETGLLEAQQGYVEYAWEGGPATANYSISQGGDYVLHVVDANGCASEAGVSVAAYALPQPGISGSLTYCIGASTTLNATAGFVAYQWSNGSQQPQTVVTTPGPIAVTVTDANGCVNSRSVDVVEATELSPLVDGDLDFCVGSSTLLDGGVGYATYTWSDGSQGQTLAVSAPGQYSLSVTDAGGCAGDVTVTVVENPLPTPLIEGIPGFCTGESTSLQVSQVYADYAWAHGPDGQSVVVDAAGQYEVMVIDANGCANTAAITVAAWPLPVFSIEGTDFFCAGGETTLSVEPAFDSYLWTNGPATQAIAVDEPGTYGVVATNEYGCQSQVDLAVTEIALPVADGGDPAALSCRVIQTELGGLNTSQGAGFSYLWSGPGITPANQHLAFPDVDSAGVYTLVVTDELHNCVSAPATVVVDDITNQPAAVLQVLDALDCTTSSVVINGGASASGPEIIYQWYYADQSAILGANASQIEVSSAQTYYLQVLDTITGCDNIAAAEVEISVAYPRANAGPDGHIDCDTPRATLNGSGSEAGPSISYYWSTPNGLIESGANAPVAVAAAPGVYILLVVDDFNGCRNVDTVRVTQNIQLPTAIAGADAALDCLNESATLSGAGSSQGAGYTLQWLRDGMPLAGANGLNLLVAEPGTYTLVVTNEQNGCVGADEARVTLDEGKVTGLSWVADTPTCFGDTDGSILLTGVEGGTPPYVYSLNGGAFGRSAVFPQLGSGMYNLMVQDANGCAYQTVITVPAANNLRVDLGPDQNIELGQLADVVAEINIDSAAIRQLRWQTVAELPCGHCLRQLDLALLESTQFFIRVVDENGCVAEDRTTVFVRKERNVYVPTAFSPNGDGINDALVVYAGREVERVVSFKVFNRWGELVFSAADFKPGDFLFGWDGSYRNQMLNPAVFVWVVEVEFAGGDRELYKGDVNLMR